LVRYKTEKWDASETPFFCAARAGVFDAVRRVCSAVVAEAAAGLGKKDGGGGIASFGRHVVEGPCDVDFGLEGSELSGARKRLPQGGGRDAERLGEELGPSAEFFVGFEGRTTGSRCRWGLRRGDATAWVRRWWFA
jgi:hypothetical protein